MHACITTPVFLPPDRCLPVARACSLVPVSMKITSVKKCFTSPRLCLSSGCCCHRGLLLVSQRRVLIPVVVSVARCAIAALPATLAACPHFIPTWCPPFSRNYPPCSASFHPLLARRLCTCTHRVLCPGFSVFPLPALPARSKTSDYAQSLFEGDKSREINSSAVLC